MASGLLGRKFYGRHTERVARELLGARLTVVEAGQPVGGWILETEAYLGPHDLASHSRHGRTKRNESMWGPPGHAYVYFTYGMHWMLNIVTESDGKPGAVLLRAIYPAQGLETIRARRGYRRFRELTDGPAKLCQALGIDRELDGVDLCRASSPIIIERSQPVADTLVTVGPRVGLNNTPEPWRSKPLRFRVRSSDFEDWMEREMDK